jgi:hypothetical protein
MCYNNVYLINDSNVGIMLSELQRQYIVCKSGLLKAMVGFWQFSYYRL